MKILITGATGFIGANACNVLASRGYDIYAIDNCSLGVRANITHKAVKFIQADVRDISRMDIPLSLDCVIHLAGSSSAPMFSEKFEESVINNIAGHISVLNFCRDNNVRKLLFASTSSIYGNNVIPLSEEQSVSPPNAYAVTKHCMEELSEVFHHEHGLEVLGFRFMSVYGLHEEHKGRFANLVSQFVWGIEKGKMPVIYGDGSQSRDFINVKDVIAAFDLAMKARENFGFTIFNVGTARAVTLNELVHVVSEVLGRDIEARYVENPVKSGYVSAQLADLSKIRMLLGYEPRVSLNDGIREIVEYRRTMGIEPASLSF